MNKKKTEAILFSTVGVVAMFAIIVAVNLIAGALKVRVDLTEDNLYTLSDGTRKILSELDSKVEIRFYCTRGENQMPVALRNFADRVEDLLDEYRQASKGRIVVRRLDPQPLSDAEDSAKLDGLQGQMTQTGDTIYLGLAVSFIDSRETLPFLSPSRERLLEYDISRAIANVLADEKPVIGIMSSLPVMGGPPPMAMMQQGRMEGTDPWIFVSQLQRDFEVEEVQTTVETIDDKYKVLLLVHPKDLGEKTLYAIDQYLMRGGKLAVFMDALAMMDQTPNANPMMAGLSASSNLGNLLDAWGVKFESGQVLADLSFPTRLRTRTGQVQDVPTFLSLTEEAIDQSDVLTSQLDSLLFALPGAFTGDGAPGLNKTVIIHSSKKSQLVEKMTAQMAPEQIARDFKADDKEYALAMRLTGKFKTAFPDGAPAAPETKAEGDDAAKEEKKEVTSLKESSDEAVVTLFADTDWLYDQWSVQVQNFLGQRIISPMNGNLSLVQNLVEQLAGNVNLIGVRSRATQSRPFTVVKKMQAEASERYQDKIKELEEELSETQNRLNELQRTRQDGANSSAFILSPEQQKEIENFRKKEAEFSKKLKEERKNLRRGIDALETRIQWLNIAGMPLLVALTGIGLAWTKRKKTAAK